MLLVQGKNLTPTQVEIKKWLWSGVLYCSRGLQSFFYYGPVKKWIFFPDGLSKINTILMLAMYYFL